MTVSLAEAAEAYLMSSLGQAERRLEFFRRLKDKNPQYLENLLINMGELNLTLEQVFDMAIRDKWPVEL